MSSSGRALRLKGQRPLTNPVMSAASFRTLGEEREKERKNSAPKGGGETIELPQKRTI
jgi:hypothetical protein